MASTYLSRTLGTSTNTYKGTVSVWLKRSGLSSDQVIYGNYTSGTQRGKLVIAGDSKLMYYQNDGGVNTIKLETNRLFRDVGAFYHIVLSVDTTQATASDRVKLYVNGVQETSFTTATYPSQNTVFYLNANSVLNYIGQEGNSSDYWDGSMAHLNVIDGTAYTPTSFGETDSTSGIWKPKTAPSVTYGNNGFFLKFENSGAMGTDSSGNGNNFTVSGNLTQNLDTPSNNYSTLTPLVSRKGTLTNGNLTHEGSGATAPNNVISSLGVTSGKFYIEAKIITANNYNGFGVVTEKNPYVNSGTDYLSNSNDALMYVYSDIYRGGGTISGTYATLATNDIVQIAIDADNKFLYFGVNGTWQNSSDPTSGSSGTGALNMTTYLGSDVTYFVSAETGGASNTRKIEFNFGQGYFGTTAVASAGTAPSEGGIFEYDCPSGYQALCTKGINSF